MKENNSKKYGIITGLMIVLIMAILSISGDHNIGYIKYVKYAPLAIMIVVVAMQLKKTAAHNNFFGKMMKSGFQLSLYAGLVAAFGVILLYGLNPAYAPLKFNVSPESWGTAIVISFMILIEAMVLGNIINFIVIQGFKPGAETVNQ